MSIESLGAVVSDNDGSAFITKAEFDSLKNDFQSQIDQYNTSIDAKIDGAIASYLSGIKVSRTSNEKFFDGNGDKVLVCDTSEIDDLKWGKFGLEIEAKSVYCGPATSTYKWNTGIGHLWWKAVRTARSPFECFRYNPTTKKLNAYSQDLEVTFKTDRSRTHFATFSEHDTADTSSLWGLRWHCCANYTTAMGTTKDSITTWIWNNVRTNIYNDAMDNYNKYNTWLHSPNWVECWFTGQNISTIGSIADPSFVGIFSLSDELTINKETKILTIFDDTARDQQNKLWTPSNATETSIDLKVLNSDGHPTNDDYDFAINYNKTGRTLRYDTPGAAGVNLTSTIFWGLNTRQTRYFYSRRLLGWRTTGGTNAANSSMRSTDYWYEPYFENSKEYSKNIINASATNALLGTYGTYGWTGKIVEGIPIAEVKEGDEVSFNITLPDELVLGFMTTPFSVGTKVKDVPARTDLDITIDGTEVNTYASKSVSAGNHKVVLKYNGVDKKAVFFKIGRPSSDDGKSDRYLVTLPTEFVRTSAE